MGRRERRTILFHFCFLQSNPSPPPCLFPHLFSLIPYHSSPIATIFPTPIHRSLSVVHFLLFPFAIPYPPFPYPPFPLFPILLSSIPFPLFPIPCPFSLSSIPFPYPTISYPLSPIPHPPFPLSLFSYSLSSFPQSLFPYPLSPISYPLSLFPYSFNPYPPFPLSLFLLFPILLSSIPFPLSPTPYPLFLIPYPFSLIPYPLLPIQPFPIPLRLFPIPFLTQLLKSLDNRDRHIPQSPISFPYPSSPIPGPPFPVPYPLSSIPRSLFYIPYLFWLNPSSTMFLTSSLSFAVSAFTLHKTKYLLSPNPFSLSIYAMSYPSSPSLFQSANPDRLPLFVLSPFPMSLALTCIHPTSYPFNLLCTLTIKLETYSWL